MIAAESLKTTVFMPNSRASEFSQFYDTYITGLYNFIYFRTYHKQTAEDLTSTTMLKAYEHFQSFDAKKGSFKSWLFRIAQNTIVDHFRTYKTTEDITDAFDLSDKSNLSADLENREKLAKVKKYLSALPHPERDIVIMRVWDELSYEEIASITGKSVGASKMTFFRTINKLRDTMPMGALLLFLTFWH